jgi:hypothetical protein
MRELAKDKLFTLCWKIYCTARDFFLRREKSLRAATGPGHVPGKEQSGEPYTFWILKSKSPDG